MSKETFNVSNIQWDLSDEDEKEVQSCSGMYLYAVKALGLPDWASVAIDDDYGTLDERDELIADALSDTFGHCVLGFAVDEG